MPAENLRPSPPRGTPDSGPHSGVNAPADTAPAGPHPATGEGTGSVWLGLLIALPLLAGERALGQSAFLLKGPPSFAAVLLTAALLWVGGLALPRAHKKWAGALSTLGMGVLFLACGRFLLPVSADSGVWPGAVTAGVGLMVLLGAHVRKNESPCGLLLVLAAGLLPRAATPASAAAVLAVVLGVTVLAAVNRWRAPLLLSLPLFYGLLGFALLRGLLPAPAATEPALVFGFLWAAGYVVTTLSLHATGPAGGAMFRSASAANLLLWLAFIPGLSAFGEACDPRWMLPVACCILLGGWAGPLRGAAAGQAVVVLTVALALLAPRPWLTAALAAECLALALATRRPARVEPLLLGAVLVLGLLPGDLTGGTPAPAWPGVACATGLLMLAAAVRARVRDGSRREFLSLFYSAAAALLLTGTMAAHHGADVNLAYMLAAVSALMLGAGWALSTPSLRAGAMLPLLAAHLCFYLFRMDGLRHAIHAAGFAIDGSLFVAVTLLAAGAWENYLARFHRKEQPEWDHAASVALPWLGAVLLAGMTVSALAGPVPALTTAALLAAVMLLFARHGAMNGAGLAGCLGLFAVAALHEGVLFSEPALRDAMELGNWSAVPLALAFFTGACRLWDPAVRWRRMAGAALQIIGLGLLARCHQQWAATGAERVVSAWLLAAGFGLTGLALGAAPGWVGALLVLAWAVSETLAWSAPAFAGVQLWVFFAVAGLLTGGVSWRFRHTLLPRRPDGHASPE